jgi:hypothetical protein
MPSQVISGFIIQNLGVPATFGFCAIWYAVLSPVIYFLVLETSYSRRLPDQQPHAEGQDEQDVTVVIEDKAEEGKARAAVRYQGDESIGFGEVIPAREPYQKRLRLFHGRFSKDSFWKGVVKPIPLMCYPAVLYATIVNGFHFAGLITMALLSVNIFSAAPYNLKPSQIGLTNIPHLVVSFVFGPLSGLLADWIARVFARHNRGIFEPEFRLTLMLIAIPVSTVAFVGFGEAVAEQRKLVWILFYSALQAVSVPFASQAALTYVMDCHPQDSNQAFVTVNFAKTVLIFVATSKVSGWYESRGPRSVFNTLAILNLAISMLTIPAYLYGKRFRSMVSTIDLRSRFLMLID